MSGALSHIRVLDLTRVLAGPWACQALADLGADVIKIERPKTGDDTRAWGPPYLKDPQGKDTREAAYYLSANRNKKSVTVDIATPEGQAIIRKLAAQSDVFIENYKVGDMARYGLSYDDLKELNPRLVYCSITGFGQTGPMSSFAGYDFIIQGMGGLMSITGERDDLPGGGPQKVGVAFADLMTGMYSALAIVAALESRNLTGKGQYIDMALLDVQVAAMANMNMNYLASGNVPKRQGNAHANIVPYQVFRSKDGHLILAVGNDRQFAKFCDIAGCPELTTDERFATNAARVRNRQLLVSMLQEILLTRTTQEWVAPLEAAGVPSGPINNIAQTFEHPQVKHRKMKVELPHPQSGTVPLVANPMKLSGTPVTYRLAPPLLGQHTQEILSTLGGLSAGEIDALASKGVI
ncbi:MAG TPA: CaiB/BaiF CoA-transferase family protein [Noviherbaspirillum sp.]|uniref:CaiB/BaiF CoA transferase family protein n=1 Tax=Noviherbaspirillum sp. TaxID=1926288 RepID=UPI002B49BC74|nr:CaiB/BaiF CoA-transferase family protein [Noviherbaspirillum sp.]HJV84663.1 CaiB/BaiF CoA-transferase family protein [Noviherbaspirillum sp.]